MIKSYIQGEQTDKELFGHIGEWVVSKDVHNLLGLAVTGNPGDVWQVCFILNKPLGFCQMRIQSNRFVHLRYLYATTAKVREELVDAALQFARDMKSTCIYTNDRHTERKWVKNGFKEHTKKRGHFSRWERCFNEKSGV